MEQHQDIRQLLHLASDVLQDVVCSAATGSASDENMLKKTNEVITSKMIRMIALLSQFSIDQGNLAKEVRRQEKKTVRYIENLRDCIAKQNEEIKKLETSLQGSSTSTPETRSVGVNTDLIDPKDTIIAHLKEESSHHHEKLKQTELNVLRLEKENKTIRKALAKANMMLRTQQILLEEQDDRDYLWKESHSKRPAYREPWDEEEDVEIRTTPSASFHDQSSSSHIGSTKRISVRLPPSIDYSSPSVKKPETKPSNVTSMEAVSIDHDAPFPSEVDRIGEHKLTVVSSPELKTISSGPSRRYFDSPEDVESGEPLHDHDYIGSEARSPHEHNDRNSPISVPPPPTDHNHSFEEDLDFSMESTAMEEKHDTSSMKDSDPSISRLKESDDSFALISDYYDDYFRSHGHGTKDNVINDH